MAKFNEELPNDILKQFEELASGEMMKEMVQEGAKVVLDNIRNNMRKSFKTTKSLDSGLKMTKVYKTPSDDGINVHIGFYGYDEDGVPIPLKAMAREYGTSKGEAKKPFMRKSFKKAEIEAVMKKIQDKYIKGD